MKWLVILAMIPLIIIIAITVSTVLAVIIAFAKWFLLGRSFKQTFCHIFFECFLKFLNPLEWLCRF